MCETNREQHNETKTTIKGQMLLAVLTAATFLSTGALAAECVKVIGTEPAGVNVTMDPAFVTLADDSYQQNIVYNRLVNLDSNSEVIPELAKSWSVSDHGKTWTFVLEEGVSFHDGRPLTAKDVVYTFRRLIDPEVGSPAVGIMGLLIAEEIVAVDEGTVSFTTAEPIA